MKRIIAAACMTLVPSLALAAEVPDATLELTGGVLGIGVGVSWAQGILHYQGQSVPIKVRGVSLARIGAGSISASGEVYHLGELKDFSGNYASVSAGAALAGGGSTAAMRNDKGVVVQMRSMTQGIELVLGVDGLAFATKE